MKDNTKRRVAGLVTGWIQSVLAALAIILAYLIFSSQQMRTTLGISDREVYLVVFILSVLAAFTLVSGVILLGEKHEGGSASA